MGCMSSTENNKKTTAYKNKLNREEWLSLRKLLDIGTSKQETRNRDKLWEKLDPDNCGSLAFPDVERGVTRELNLEKLLTRRQLTPILVRAFNAPKAFRAEVVNNELLGGSASLPSGSTPVTSAVPPVRAGGRPASPPEESSPPLMLRRNTVSPSPASRDATLMNKNVMPILMKSPAAVKEAPPVVVAKPTNDEDDEDLFNMPAVAPIVGNSSPLNRSNKISNNSTSRDDHHLISSQNKSGTKVAELRSISPTNPFAIPLRARGADGTVNSRPTSPALLSASMSSVSRVSKGALLREEFRLFLMYMAYYVDLFIAYTDTAEYEGADFAKVSLHDFIAIETFLESVWGIYVDNDADKVYDSLAKSKSGELAYKDFADWAIRERMQIQLRVLLADNKV